MKMKITEFIQKHILFSAKVDFTFLLKHSANYFDAELN